MQRSSVAGRLRGRLAVVVLTLTLAVAACGGGGAEGGGGQGGGAQEEKKVEDPYEKRVSAAEVGAGLRKIEGMARDAAAKAGTDKAGAAKVNDEIHHQWEEIEGTVKANDQNAYVAYEDNFALLKSGGEKGDAAQARTAADKVSQAVNSYLAKHPA